MKLARFDDVLRYIDELEDPVWPKVAADYLDRIHFLIDHTQDRWDDLYGLTFDVEIVHCPWQIGVPEDDWTKDNLSNRDRSIVEILLDNMEELSGADWFDCEPSAWLGIFAASNLGNGIHIYRIVSYAVSEAEGPVDQELLDHLPFQLPANYLRTSEALIAAEVLRKQHELLRRERQSRAASGGRERNKPYILAHEQFIEYYLANNHLSRAEAARRFYAKLTADLGPHDRPLYRNEECAVRALRGALKAAGI
jgi:hypothetical protein